MRPTTVFRDSRRVPGLWLALLLAPLSARGQIPPPASAPTSGPTSAPSTSTGSLALGVRYQDIGFTLRTTFFKSITTSPHDPQVAYIGSWDGYLFKTVDGGKTWDESRLIVEPRPFYADQAQRLYFGRHRMGEADWARRHRTDQIGGQGVPRMERALLRMRPERVAYDAIRPGSANRRGAAANVNFGIGLPGSAPRMQNVVRKFSYTRPANLGMVIGAAGLNLKQMLLYRGVRPTEVRLVVPHPKNPKIVFACTHFGLFKTYDGGLNWVRVFLGINPMGRKVQAVAVDPFNERRVLLVTGNGLYVSDDGGENFIKSGAQGVGEGMIDWVSFDPYREGYAYVGTNYGMLRSADHGDTWTWSYFTTFPAARIVRYVEVDPTDKKRGYIATHDGVWSAPDIHTATLDDWQRMGGMRFTGTETWKIAACPRHRGHLWVLSNLVMPQPILPGNRDTGGSFIWESIDGGVTWRVIYSGHTQGAVQWFDLDLKKPDLLWIIWSRAAARMVHADPEPTTAAAQRLRARQRARLREKMSRYPPFAEAVIAAMRFHGTEYKLRWDYRFRATLKALVPRLDMSYTYYRLRDYPLLHDALYNRLPFRFDSAISYRFDEYRVMLTWDLSDLVFNLLQTTFGRIYRINEELHSWMMHAFMRFYGELRRLHALMIVDRPTDLRVRLIYKMRVQELESYLDLITGGFISRYQRRDRPSPWDTPWFERWPDTGPWFKEATNE